jgi:MFS family permease
MSTPQLPETRELGQRGRALGAIAWSSFLAAALGMLLCFAFVDPEGIAAGELPSWWTTRRAVYALGFFLFWLIGVVAALLCWQLARPEHRGG